MRGYGTLTTRVRRLEKRHRVRRPRPAIVFTIYEDQEPGEIEGVASQAGVVPREPWEPLGALLGRAHALLGARIVAALYATQ